MSPEPGREDGGPSREEILRRSGRLLGIGGTFVASILLCLGGGWWLDAWLGTTPWLTLAGALLGIAAGFYFLIEAVREAAGGGDEED